jgi:hypothetical protein
LLPSYNQVGEAQWLVAFSNAVNQFPVGQQLAYAKSELCLLPEPPRESFTLIYFAGASMNDLQKAQWQRTDRIYAMVFGAATIVFLAVVAVLIPDPKPFQIFIFRLIASLGAGATGAFVPGSLTAGIKRPSFTIRASGALGLAVIVYLINPPAIAAGH